MGMNRRQSDDRTAACVLHIVQHLLGAENLTAHVDGEQFFKMRGRDRGQWERLRQTGVVDQHVQPAEMIDGGVHDLGAYGSRLREIALNRRGRSAFCLNLRHGRGRALVTEGIVADHRRTLAGQFQSDALPDAAAIDAGDERPFADKRILAAHVSFTGHALRARESVCTALMLFI